MKTSGQMHYLQEDANSYMTLCTHNCRNIQFIDQFGSFEIPNSGTLKIVRAVVALRNFVHEEFRPERNSYSRVVISRPYISLKTSFYFGKSCELDL